MAKDIKAPEWPEYAVSVIQSDIGDLKEAIKKLTAMEIGFARCHEGMARYGTRLDYQERKLHNLEVSLAKSDVTSARNDKILWAFIGVAISGMLGLIIWIISHPGIFLGQL